MRFPSLNFLKKGPWWEDKHYRNLGRASASSILKNADVRNNPLMWGTESLLRDTRQKALEQVSPLQSVSYNIGELDSREKTARRLSLSAVEYIRTQRRILEDILNARALRDGVKGGKSRKPRDRKAKPFESFIPPRWLTDSSLLPQQSRRSVGTPIGARRYFTIQAFEDVLGTKGKSSLSKTYLQSGKV